jgi:hypothetical protein
MLLLKPLVPSNIPIMRTTLSVFHNDKSPVKDENKNIEVISVHRDVSHNEISPLKAKASLKVDDMVVTWETSQGKLLLNRVAFSN